MRKLYDYLKEGYEVSPYYQDVDLKCKTTIRVVDLTSKELKDLLGLFLLRNHLHNDFLYISYIMKLLEIHKIKILKVDILYV